jgi:GT2 family glycosyltransferase
LTDSVATSGVNSGLGPVSVVVCNFDGERYLDACLDAVAKLDAVVDEVIVVDNASRDASRVILAERFSSVRVIAMEKNDGPCPARNAGMRAAKNRWVLALDNDAVCTPAMLSQLCAAVAANADVAIAQPRSVFATEPGRVHYDGGAFHYAGLISLRNFYRPLEDAVGHGIVDVDCAVAVALLVDRDAILALGGYDETMFILFEDLDLSFRLRATGRRILSVEDAIVLHAGGTPGISFREGPSYPGSRVFFHSRNRWTYMAKCYRKRTLLVASPALALYEITWFTFALFSGSIGPWWRGKRAFFSLRHHIRRERAKIQSERTRNDRDLLVSGPLTVTPALRASNPRRALLTLLDSLLTLWWKITRPLAG